MTNIEANGYVANPEDIQEITQSVLDANALSSDGRATYLRALVATTQSALGMVLTKKRGVIPSPDEDELKRHLEALESTHEKFYVAVMKVVQATPLLDEERGRERNIVYARRANFARSAKATLRAWMLSENNIRSLVASKVTKYGLQAEITKRRGQPIRGPSEKRIARATEKLLERIKSAGSTEESIRLLEAAIARLVSGLNDLGVETTSNHEKALKEHKLVKTQTGIIYFPARGISADAATA